MFFCHSSFADNVIKDNLETHYKGKNLIEALTLLNQQGHKLMFSSQLIHKGMIINDEPDTKSVQTLVEQILLPFKLTIISGPQNSYIIVKQETEIANKMIAGQVFDATSGERIDLANIRLYKVDTEVNSNNWLDESALTKSMLIKEIKTFQGEFTYQNLPLADYVIEISSAGYINERLFFKQAIFSSGEALVIELNRSSIEKIVISASQYDITYSQSSDIQFMGQEDIEKLSHLTNDVNRAITKLPGVAGGDVSARAHIRGGSAEENSYLLDGMPFYNAYHMKLGGSYFGIIDSFLIDQAQIITGGAPVEFGEHLSGVINLTSSAGDGEYSTALGIDFLTAKLKTGGNFNQGDNNWFISARRGFLNVIGATSSANFEGYSPQYSDIFIKTNIQVTDQHQFTWHSLVSQDEDSCLGECINGHDGKLLSSYHWLNLNSDWHDIINTKTLIGYADIEEYRNGMTMDSEFDFIELEEKLGISELDDRLDWSFFLLKQDWKFTLSDTQLIKVGAEVKWLNAVYDYRMLDNAADPFLALSQQLKNVENKLNIEVSGETYSVYIADLFKVNKALTIEAGLRWDKQTYTDEQQFSPRINIDYLADNGVNTKLSWGKYYQGQGIHQLAVQDNISTFHQAQQVEQINFSYQQSLNHDYQTKISLYYKDYQDVPARFENILGSEFYFYETRGDRYLFEPQSAKSQGIEFSLQKQNDEPFNWWFSYVLSKAEEKIAGITLPKRWDQKHSFKLALNYQFSPSCYANILGNYHTGWRTSSLTQNQLTPIDDINQAYFTLGTPYDEQYPDFLRFDMRIACEQELVKGRLRYVFKVINMLNRYNSSGLDTIGDILPARNDYQEKTHLPFIVSLGVIWEF